MDGQANATLLPDTASQASFYDLAQILRSISTKKGTEAKRQKIRQYINEWRRTGGDFYPALRLILPHLDKERKGYQMKEKVLAKTYVDVLGLSIKSNDAQSLLNWKNPGKSGKMTAGDFIGALYNLLRARSNVRDKSSVTIADVNEQLDLLTVAMDQRERQEVIRYFFKNCTPLEQMWIARVILKDMKLGISENTILKEWHPDALDLYNICNELSRVTSELRDPRVRQGQQEITLFTPFTPMLCHSVQRLGEVPKLMTNEPFYIETKLDGERILMHMQRLPAGSKFKWWSRQAKDYTSSYGANKDEGSLVPSIHDLIDPKVQSMILDGEMLAYDRETEVYVPFGSLKSAIKDVLVLGVNDAKLRICYNVFDVLYYNGKSLATTPLRERRALLPTLFRAKPTYMEINPFTVGETVQDIFHALDERMERNEEGLIIKNPSASYLVAKRISTDWVKVKADYLAGYGNDIDLLVVGGLFGQGRRGGRISQFMCAVWEDARPDGVTAPAASSSLAFTTTGGTTPSRRCVSFCKFGTGYKDDQIDLISRRNVDGLWQKYDPRKPPAWFVHPRNSKEKPDYIITSPEQAIVVQIKAFEIVKSDTYGAGWTLRFPRFAAMREDKTPDEAATFSMILQRVQGGGMQKRRRLEGIEGEFDAEGEEGDGPANKKQRRGRAALSSAIKVAAQHMGIDVSRITKSDDLFTGMQFCVLPGAGTEGEAEESSKDGPKNLCVNKAAIETLIAQHGGDVVQNPTAQTKMVIADQHTLKVSNLKKAAQYDIVKSRYIAACLSAREIITLCPRFMIHATPKTLHMFRENADQWGDSYFEDLKVSTLKELFSHMEVPAWESDPTKKKRGTMRKQRKLEPVNRPFFDKDSGESTGRSDDDEAVDDNRPPSPVSRLTTIQEIEERYFTDAPHEGGLFRPCRVYLDRYTDIRVVGALLATSPDTSPTQRVDWSLPDGTHAHIVESEDDNPQEDRVLDSRLDVLALKIRARGGVICGALGEHTTHVVVDAEEVREGLMAAGQGRGEGEGGEDAFLDAVAGIQRRNEAGQSKQQIQQNLTTSATKVLHDRIRTINVVLGKMKGRFHRRVHVVADEWVDDAVDLGRRPDERGYVPVFPDRGG